MTEPILDFAFIEDPTGLHARPAVKVSKLAKKFDCDVELSASDGENWINAKSTNAVMKLKASSGTKLLVRAAGADASAAVAGIVGLIRRDFQDA